ncbi:MAG: hypothetical protein JOZ19_14125 [Rubrobacter sp.]|nr:hypothetical protein [Rubrobacter sp.]
MMRVADLRAGVDDEREIPQLRIADLLANTPVEPEAHLDDNGWSDTPRCSTLFHPLSSSTPERGFSSSMGYHRVAAARRHGLETIEAEVRRGAMRCSTPLW